MMSIITDIIADVMSMANNQYASKSKLYQISHSCRANYVLFTVFMHVCSCCLFYFKLGNKCSGLVTPF